MQEQIPITSSEPGTARSHSGLPFRKELLLFLAIFLACAYFYSNGGWNQASRFDAIFALVENGPDRGTFRIDRFIVSPEHNLNTGDWARHDGHYYSNKAPGPIFLGIAVYAPLYYLERLFLATPLPPRLDLLNAYLINLFASGFWIAVAAIYFRRTLLLLGSPPAKATFFTLVFGWCTPLLPYAGQLWGHPTAAAFLVLSFYHLLRNRPGSDFLSGLFLGAATLCDYLAAPAVVIFSLPLLLGNRRAWGRFLLGGLPMLLLFLGYHQLCFGSPFRLATMENNPLFLDPEKTGGMFGGVSSYLMLQLLIGIRRGLLVGSPILLLAVPGFRHMFRQPGLNRLAAFSAVAMIAVTLLINSAFNGWHGGHSISPRYLIITLPFWVIGAAQWSYARRWRQVVLLTLAGWSLTNMIVTAALTPMCPQDAVNPLYGEWYPRFFSGNFLTGIYPLRLHFMLPEWPQLSSWSSFNLGNLLGLHGLASLLPLAVLLPAFFLPAIRRWPGCPVWPRRYFRCPARPQFLTLALAGMVLFTLLYPGDTAWINDEPLLLKKALDAADHGTWTINGLTGSVGVSYGPTAVWLYEVMLLFTTNPVVMALLKTVLTLGVVLWALRDCGQRLNREWRLAALLLLSSPYFYYYSRMLWDNVLLIPLSFIAAALTVRFFRDGKILPLLGATAALLMMFLLHPMSMPVLAAFTLTLLAARGRRLWENRRRLLLPAAAVLAIIIPWVLHLGRNFRTGTTMPAPWGYSLVAGLTGFGNLTFQGFSDYFIPEYTALSPLPEEWMRLLFGLTAVMIGLTALLGAVIILRRWLTAREPGSPAELLERFCLLALILNLLMTVYLRQYHHPHYNSAVMFAWLFLVWRGMECSRRFKPVAAAVAAVIGVQALLLFGLGQFVRNHHGNRGLHYGATLGNQWEIVLELTTYARQYRAVRMESRVDNHRRFPQALTILIELAQRGSQLQGKRRPETVTAVIDYAGAPPDGALQLRATAETVIPATETPVRP